MSRKNRRKRAICTVVTQEDAAATACMEPAFGSGDGYTTNDFLRTGAVTVVTGSASSGKSLVSKHIVDHSSNFPRSSFAGFAMYTALPTYVMSWSIGASSCGNIEEFFRLSKQGGFSAVHIECGIYLTSQSMNSQDILIGRVRALAVQYEMAVLIEMNSPSNVARIIDYRSADTVIMTAIEARRDGFGRQAVGRLAKMRYGLTTDYFPMRVEVPR